MEWPDRLFADRRQLPQHTYFWTKAWSYGDVGLYHDFEGPLEQLEYQIIGLTSDLYADRLLNEDGAWLSGPALPLHNIHLTYYVMVRESADRGLSVLGPLTGF